MRLTDAGLDGAFEPSREQVARILGRGGGIEDGKRPGQ